MTPTTRSRRLTPDNWSVRWEWRLRRLWNLSSSRSAAPSKALRSWRHSGNVDPENRSARRLQLLSDVAGFAGVGWNADQRGRELFCGRLLGVFGNRRAV